MSPRVAVIRTGAANLASVVAGLERAGADAFVTDDPRDADAAAAICLPGVGAFGPAMERLRGAGLDGAVLRAARSDRPLLAICLGLQLLCGGSEESPGVHGLGLIPGMARRFPASVRVPQLGWNTVTPDDAPGLLTRGHAYFANSYALRSAPPGWRAATADFAGLFVAALERGRLMACQFHPELSGEYGRRLLRSWVQGAAREIGRGAPC